MKKTFQILTISIFGITNAQVGINTETPQAELHVDGSIQLTKELNVGGDASTAGNAGAQGQILSSNGAGEAPEWTTPEDSSIPTVSTIGLRSNLSAYYNASTTNNVIYSSIPKIDNTRFTYNASTGIFSVLKAGYYQITVCLEYDLSTNPIGQTSGTAISTIENITTGERLTSSTTNHAERTPSVFHNLSGIGYFEVGQNFRVTGTHTRRYRFEKSSISIISFGE